MSIQTYLNETKEILDNLDQNSIQEVIEGIRSVKKRKGRLFILGVGGSAANASHAVNDFRKICGIDAYAPTDNVSELTARTNDDGWEYTFIDYLTTCNLTPKDAVLVFSVGGGTDAASPNISQAVKYANQEVGCQVYGIVGRYGGDTLANAAACVLLHVSAPSRITPHVEGISMVLLHLIVTELKNEN